MFRITLKQTIAVAILTALVGYGLYATTEPAPVPMGADLQLVPLDKDVMEFNKKVIVAKHTDENVGENLIIKTDRATYGAWDRFVVYFSITNISLQEQLTKIQFMFDSGATVTSIHALNPQVAKQVEVPIITESACITTKSYICEDGEILKTVTGATTTTVYVDEMNTLSLANAQKQDSPKTVPNKFVLDKEAEYLIGVGETKFFVAEVDIANTRGSGEWYIEAFGHNGGYGTLR